jgi:hypothetical protein
MASRELKLVFRPEAWSTSFVSDEGHDRRQSRGANGLIAGVGSLSVWVQSQQANALISKEDHFFTRPGFYDD